MELGMDLTTFAGLAAATMLVISLLKQVAYKLVKGREMWLALLLPVAFGVAMKATGEAFADVGWVNLVIASVMASFGAHMGHDKMLPLAKGLWNATAPKAMKVEKKKKKQQ